MGRRKKELFVADMYATGGGGHPPVHKKILTVKYSDTVRFIKPYRGPVYKRT